MEQWDIYDRERRLTGRTMKKNDWILQDGEYHLTVLGVVRNTDGRFLITRRVLTKAWAAGWWVLAGVGGQLPYFDSINFVISFIAQVLYVLKYNENWSLWIFVNIANFVYWSILSVQMMMGDNTIGTLGANLSQVALQAALLFNAVYAQKVWNSGEADNEGGAA